MRVIVLAAGDSRRFKEAGYETPKPFLKVNWRDNINTMLGHVINTIPIDLDYIIAYHKGWRTELTASLGFEIGNTKGPADTALQVLIGTRYDATLIIDCDILNTTNDLARLLRQNSCAVLVKKSANPAYSYVDNLGLFTHIVEKERISDYAVQGAYF